MATFLSGTDTATLKEEGADRNHFVSLIVNNAGTYTAAITRKIKYTETRKLGYATFEGKEINDITEEYEEAEEIEYFMLNIVFENPVKKDFSDIDARLEEIKKNKAKAKPIADIQPKPASYFQGKSYSKEPTLFDDEACRWEAPSYKKDDFKDYEYFEEIPYKTRSKVTESLLNNLICQMITGSITMTPSEKFNPKQWVTTTMEKVFDKRFGKGVTGLVNFREWAMPYVEFIITCSIDTEDHDEDAIAFLLADGLIKKLRALGKNDYINTFIDLLETYAEFV